MSESKPKHAKTLLARTKHTRTTPETRGRPKVKQPKLSRSIRFRAAEVAIIQSLADQYCEGNFSDWVRRAAVEFDPAITLVPLDKTN